jgi:hypothetical protein
MASAILEATHPSGMLITAATVQSTKILRQDIRSGTGNCSRGSGMTASCSTERSVHRYQAPERAVKVAGHQGP